jgi:tripartite-type tricarboxylate transporter receptor subunit TctC
VGADAHVEIIVPAGTGGGADQMARTIQGIVTKHNLMKQSMVVITGPAAPAVRSSTSRDRREIHTS